MKKVKLNPVQRAVIAKNWRKSMVDAKIHALIGGDSDKLVNYAGRIFFVVLGAACLSGMSGEEPDLGVVVEAVTALHEQAGKAEISDFHRSALVAGLEASSRIIGLCQHEAIVKSACDIELAMKNGGNVAAGAA